jgi:hypothetical protein
MIKISVKFSNKICKWVIELNIFLYSSISLIKLTENKVHLFPMLTRWSNGNRNWFLRQLTLNSSGSLSNRTDTVFPITIIQNPCTPPMNDKITKSAMWRGRWRVTVFLCLVSLSGHTISYYQELGLVCQFAFVILLYFTFSLLSMKLQKAIWQLRKMQRGKLTT